MEIEKRNLFINAAVLIALIVIVMVVSPSSGDVVSQQIEDDTLILEISDQYAVQIPLEEILLIELCETEDYGEPLDEESGGSTNQCYYGMYVNEDWGEYTACVSKSVETCIVLSTEDGTIVFNCESDTSTQEYYSAFTEYLGQA